MNNRVLFYIYVILLLFYNSFSFVVETRDKSGDLVGFHKLFTGTFKINETTKNAVCECFGDDRSYIDRDFGNSKCKLPMSYHTRHSKKNDGTPTKSSFPFDLKKLRDWLGKPSFYHMVDVDSTSFSCTDGRNGEEILGTPGGDFAEFVGALSIFLISEQSLMYQQSIDRLLLSWLENPINRRREFYFHTDIHALRAVQIETKIPDKLFNISDPAPPLQGPILEALINPKNQGCIHLRLMMEHPGYFGAKLKIIQMAIKSYFTILWRKDLPGPQKDKKPLFHRLKLVVSEGEHKEKGWANFYANKICDQEGFSYVWSPYFEKTSLYIEHPQAVGVLRRRLAQFFSIQGIESRLGYRVMLHDLVGLRRKQTQITRDFLTQNIPQFDILLD